MKKLRRPLFLIPLIAIELVACYFLCLEILGTVEFQNRAVRQEAEAAKVATLVLHKTSGVIPASTGQLAEDGEEIVRTAWIESIQEAAANLEYIEASTDYNIEDSEVYQAVQGAYVWDGAVLSKGRGTVTGPNGRETYYNLNMDVIVRMMRARGNTDAYWVRSDGVKMLGNYVMVAANLNVHPRGSIVHSSVGLAIVCDTGGFAAKNPQQLDIAAAW